MIVDAIKARKSCRRFTSEEIDETIIEAILTAGTLAPSGKNGQPWKFVTVQRNKELLNAVSDLSAYGKFMREADCLIAVYLDKQMCYNYIKDVQAIGACIENMLLQAAELGIGSCWIGEILSRAEEVNALLGIGGSLELMAVIALGYPADKSPRTKKKGLKECLLKSL